MERTHTLTSWNLRIATGLLVLGQILFLTPRTLEAPPPFFRQEGIDLDLLRKELIGQNASLARGIPEKKAPEYFLNEFVLLSTRGNLKEWRVESSRAHVYKEGNLLHNFVVEATVFDSEKPKAEPTLLWAKESKTAMTSRDVDLYGEVRVLFPDGLELRSEELTYRAKDRKVTVPVGVTVFGRGKDIEFESQGLIYDLRTKQADLLDQVHVTLSGRDPSEVTQVDSDTARVFRNEQTVAFDMSPKRESEDRFVRTRQPRLRVKSRKLVGRFGPASRGIQWLTAQEDVTLIELENDAEGAKVTRRSTSGIAEFEAERNTISLKILPQVYQDEDTLTGEVIRLHRDSDLVEVERGNALSDGKQK
jgi:LPS export ABC transporter protein LptC